MQLMPADVNRSSLWRLLITQYSLTIYMKGSQPQQVLTRICSCIPVWSNPLQGFMIACSVGFSDACFLLSFGLAGRTTAATQTRQVVYSGSNFQ